MEGAQELPVGACVFQFIEAGLPLVWGLLTSPWRADVQDGFPERTRGAPTLTHDELGLDLRLSPEPRSQGPQGLPD